MKEGEPKIIYKSILQYIVLAIVSYLFVLINVFICAGKGWDLMHILAMVFFGVCGMYYSYVLGSKRYKFIKIGSEEFKEQTQKEFEAKQNDLGYFEYSEDGFRVKLKSGNKTVKWNDIDTIISYKVDKWTIDEIVMQLYLADGTTLNLGEDTPGWYQFAKRIKEAMPELPATWQIDIAAPAFQRKTTLLFDRKGRTLEQVLAEMKEKGK